MGSQEPAVATSLLVISSVLSVLMTGFENKRAARATRFSVLFLFY